MLDVAFRFTQKKLKINLLFSLIIGITLLLGIICISTYDKLTEKTRLYSSFLNMKGGLYNFGYLNFMDELMKKGISPDEYHGVKESIFGIDNYSFHLQAYDSLQSQYRIPLKEGVWYTDVKESEFVNVVVTPNKYFKLGDIIHPADYMEELDSDLYLRVCGITEDKFSYLSFSKNPKSGLQELYEDFVVDEVWIDALMFLSVEDVQNYKGFVYKPFVLLGFGNIEAVKAVDQNAYDYAKYASLDELREKTEVYIEQKIYEVLPIFLVVLIMTFICIVSVTAIEITFELRTYAILFFCGMKWRAIVGINIIRCTLIYIIGLGIMSCIGTVSKELLLKRNLIITMGSKQYLLCMCMYVVLVLIFSIIPAIIVKKNSPVEVIRRRSE